ncbi:hypothetical protein [Sphingomonas sp.]|uniref:hypothetical protein n=1 Tax=Sphingomonas sp. TaxID=28214 RepID=UPI003D6C72EE
MFKLYHVIVAVWMRFSVMSDGAKYMAVFHLTIDLLLLAALVAFVVVGLTRDPNAFVVWVPLLSVALYFRFKQTKERWKL